ncbi:hypothetical protein NFI96_000486 [Prochilodus magdalenae]|nr:hypothetical protein NFI96_000486 [Prochilodus magdalenae]
MWSCTTELQNGSLKLEPLSASLVRSVAAVAAQASVATVTSPPMAVTGDVHLGMSTGHPYTPPTRPSPNHTPDSKLPAYDRGVRYFSLTESGESRTPEAYSPPPAEAFGQSVPGRGVAVGAPANEQRQEEESGWRDKIGFAEPPHAFPRTHTLTHAHGRGETEPSRQPEQEREKGRERQREWEREQEQEHRREKESALIPRRGYLSPDAFPAEPAEGVLSGGGPDSVQASPVPPPDSLLHVFMELALCTGVRSFWNRKGPSPNCPTKLEVWNGPESLGLLKH